MNDRHRTAFNVVLAVALIVAVPAATELFTASGGTGGPNTETDGDRADGRLPADPDAVLTRVERLVGAENLENVTIVVRNESEMSFDTGGAPTFHRAIGLTAPNESGSALARTVDGRTIVVRRALLDRPARFEATLAHEYAHLLQERTGVPRRIATAVHGDATASGDGAMVLWALYEGGATYVEQAYWERHLGNGTSPRRLTERSYRTASGRQKYLLSGHYWGYRYLERVVDDPASLGSVYDDPPRTSEELLHALEPGSEPVRPLSVTVERGWNRTQPSATMGELFVRVVLADALSPSRAAAGAEGWGNDTRLSLARNGSRGHVWVTTWDDADDAAEFRDAFEAYLSKRGVRSGDRWSLNESSITVCGVDGRTVAICAGDPAFLDAVSVQVAGDTVRVTNDTRASTTVRRPVDR